MTDADRKAREGEAQALMAEGFEKIGQSLKIKGGPIRIDSITMGERGHYTVATKHTAPLTVPDIHCLRALAKGCGTTLEDAGLGTTLKVATTTAPEGAQH